jgi:hypothetical protein
MPPGNPLDFLDTKGRLYLRWLPTWQMNERRAFGQVTADLMKWAGESDERYTERQNRATYVNFMTAHASAVTGQLRLQGAPTPENGRLSFGSLGPIRSATQVRRGDESLGELAYFNLDGVGGDGSEVPVFTDAVDERAQHTGHRLLMIEAPPARVITPRAATVQEPPVISLADVQAGIRPYALEFSPEQMTMHVRRQGRMEFCILRVPQESGKVVDGKWIEPPEIDAAGNGLGYYLLVRRGCTLLGQEYARGGYWLFTASKKLIRTGLWGGRLNGEIPLWYHYGEKNSGTVALPSESRSVTEGLGRVGVSLMDTMSARDWDAFDAAGSRKWFLNADSEVMADVKVQWDLRSQNIGVPPAFDKNTGESQPVSLYDDSAGAVAPEVFQRIIEAKFAEAREQSFQAITALPGSSGWSKEAGFLEVKAPYLSRRASYRQQSDQTLIYFLEARFGRDPQGFAAWEREYKMTPLVEELEAVLDRLTLSGLRSPTLEPELAIAMVKRRLGGLPVPMTPEGQPGDPVAFEQTIRREFADAVEVAATTGAQDAGLASSFGA